MGGDKNSKRNHEGGSETGARNKVSHVDSTDPVVFDSADAQVKLTFTARDVCEHLDKAKIGRVDSIRILASGSLILTPKTPEQRNQLLRLSRIGSVSVVQRSRLSFNPSLCKKITAVPLEYSDSEMLEEIQQFLSMVREVHRLGKNSRVVRLDFSSAPPVTTVNLWGQDFRIFPFEDRPRQCKKCLRYGHNTANCRSPVHRCSKCGEDHHSSTCSKEPKCAVCHGKHDAYSKSCPQYRKEFDIRKIQQTENVSLPEARILAKSYASAASGNPVPKKSSPRLFQNSISSGNATQSSGAVSILPEAFQEALLAFIVEVLQAALGTNTSNADKIDIVISAAAKHLGSGVSAQSLCNRLASKSASTNQQSTIEPMCTNDATK